MFGGGGSHDLLIRWKWGCLPQVRCCAERLFNLGRNRFVQSRETVDTLLISSTIAMCYSWKSGQSRTFKKCFSKSPDCENYVVALRVLLLHYSVEVSDGPAFVKGDQNRSLQGSAQQRIITLH